MRKTKASINSDLIWDGKSVFWPTSPERVPNLWFCAEDAGLEIWYHFHQKKRHSGRYNFEPLKLESCSDELEEMLIASLPYSYNTTGLSRTIFDFLKMVGQTLIFDGRMVFEIRAGWNHTVNPAMLESVALSYITKNSLVRIGPFIFQIIPPGAESDDSPRRIVRLDAKRIIQFLPPQRWRRPLARIRKNLLVINRSHDLWMKQLSECSVKEDIKTVNRAYNIQFARITSPIGWNGRGLFSEDMSDFHYTLRELRWKKFCIEMRDEILQTLDDAFRRIGQLRNETPKLTCKHLPTIERIDNSICQIMKHGVRFNDILRYSDSSAS